MFLEYIETVCDVIVQSMLTPLKVANSLIVDNDYRSDLDIFAGFQCPHCGTLATSPCIIGDGTKFAFSNGAYHRERVQRNDDTPVHVGVEVNARTYVLDGPTWQSLLAFCGE